ncbi:uncharacterized protein LAJ45_04088 [Morchella importuna]|uniref:uncharacterized protein n=1 Tax=Morchella importuna TaxID=1174673 RepID=UPI001E8DAA54|nr:uncharacterized protein LAJ45_04088 [Morchella importuna]KAH8152094.1 hypothetical protein LAJ45_04088 [Morchella importuna]
MAPPPASHLRAHSSPKPMLWPLLVLLCVLQCAGGALAMTASQKMALREEARAMFRHGWENYMQRAFPEDEIKPITCTPHHRDREDPKNIGRNDAMGDFSLTAVDTLSSLAVMAASNAEDAERFWRTTEEIVRIYWYNEPKECDAGAGEDCDEKTSSWGRFQNRSRESRGFDIDAKVQIFETTIRTLGGLLSAHQFAVRSLPSLPESVRPRRRYNNELLSLAEDLGSRLLPALTESPTGLPYPRINLRYGLANKSKNPKYYKYPRRAPHPHPMPWSPQGEHESEKNWKVPKSATRESPSEEITETCTAGAGSLVLEFTALSRLTGDPKYEKAAKRAFEAVWERRSVLGLFGGGVDAETGLWNSPIAGIGAGMDSFFEYAQKAFVLFARGGEKGEDAWFWNVWEESSAAVAAHMKMDTPADWWGMCIWLRARTSWVEEAVKSNLFYTALWSRFSALPERWNVRTGTVEGGLGWYPGRPEFIESTYLLYRATKDPWYLHVGEMIMRDLKRRCWSKCGWAGLQDVRTGEKQDRMESFWLGETWSYLFLLFDEDHPLHKGDDPWVFTTEGHPLIFPKSSAPPTNKPAVYKPLPSSLSLTCENPRRGDISFFSPTASRPDTFHAAQFTRLHLLPKTPPLGLSPLQPSDLDIHAENSYFWSPTNSTFYPWTLPPHLIHPDSVCAPLPGRESFELIFPSASSSATSGDGTAGIVKRVVNGVMVTGSIRGIRMGLLKEPDDTLRVTSVGGTSLGRGEAVYLEPGLVDKGTKNDANFQVAADDEFVDLIIEVDDDAEAPVEAEAGEMEGHGYGYGYGGYEFPELDSRNAPLVDKGTLGELLAKLGLDLQISDLLALVGGESTAAMEERQKKTHVIDPIAAASNIPKPPKKKHKTIPAVMATGLSAYTPPDKPFAPASSPVSSGSANPRQLAFTNIYFSPGTGCVPDPLLPANAQIVFVRRGGCTFSQKVRNVPDVRAVKLLVIVDADADVGQGGRKS